MYTSSISDDVRDGDENFVCNDTPIYGIYLLKAHIRYRRPALFTFIQCQSQEEDYYKSI